MFGNAAVVWCGYGDKKHAEERLRDCCSACFVIGRGGLVVIVGVVQVGNALEVEADGGSGGGGSEIAFGGVADSDVRTVNHKAVAGFCGGDVGWVIGY